MLSSGKVAPGVGGGLRVALVNSSRIWGGAEKMTEVIARGLQSRGHSVLVLAREGSPLRERVRLEVTCEPVRAGFDFNPLAAWGCARALRAHRSELLMTMTQKDPRTAGPAARLLGIPVVVRHPMDVPFRDRIHHRLFYGWLPAHLIANSAATRRTMLGSAPWLDPERVTVIHNGIDLAAVDVAAPAQLGLPEGALAIGFAGRFESRKGLPELLDAWPRIAERLPGAHLVLAGAGGALEEEARRRLRGEPRVHWLGFRPDLASVLKALDLLVMPSRQEGFGLVLAEAMAAGIPVVASDATNFPELVRHGVDGLLFQVGSAAALADAVVALAGDPAARGRMGRAAAARIRSEFSVQRMIHQYDAVLTRVLERHERGVH